MVCFRLLVRFRVHTGYCGAAENRIPRQRPAGLQLQETSQKLYIFKVVL